jgi:serine/threonine protein kinase
MHEAKLHHGDIKPENILSVDGTHRSLKLIDFGNVDPLPRPYAYGMQSLWYRAPEVILRVNSQDRPDLWSVGCVLFEAFMGTPLFAAGSDIELLNRATAFLGEEIPAMMVATDEVTAEFFDMGRLKTVEEFCRDRRTPLVQGPSCPLADEIENLETAIIRYVSRVPPRDPQVEEERRILFVSFLYGLLAIDFRNRFSAEEALNDPFLKVAFTE